MSKENKFRYVFKCSECGDIVIKEYTLHEIQFGYVDYPEHVHGNLRFGYGLIDTLQFTGLKDKNEDEIYKWDIVSYYDEMMTIESIGASFMWKSSDGKCAPIQSGINMEIIGNIYENPELTEA